MWSINNREQIFGGELKSSTNIAYNRIVYFSLYLCNKLSNHILMPLRFLRILKRLISGKVVDCAAFGDVVFTHDSNSVYVFSLHVPKDCSSVVTCQLGNLVHGECVGYGRKNILEHFLEPRSFFATELIIRIMKITPTVRALRLGSARVICLFCVENTDGDFLPLLSFAFSHVGENILLSDRIFVRGCVPYLTRNDAVLKHPRRLAFADVKHLVKLLQGDASPFFMVKLAIVFDINNFSKAISEELIEFIRQKAIKVK